MFLRRIEVWDEEPNKRTLVFLTNHRGFAASTIAAIYRQRWQIELFFKALKQNLRIKTFVGTSPNALQIQIWTALIALLLLKYLQLRARFGWSLSNLAALCCASNCSSIATCSPGSMSPSSRRHCSILAPSNWCFLGEPNLDSRNANLNPEIDSEAAKCRRFRGLYASTPANLDSSDIG